jgi:hypothetical protein
LPGCEADDFPPRVFERRVFDPIAAALLERIRTSDGTSGAIHPVSSADLKYVEDTLGLKLPDWYTQRLLEYPFPEPEPELYHDAQTVIQNNLELRRDGWFGYHPWPREFFAIGDDGCGDYYFIVPSRDDRRIFMANHEGGPSPSIESLHEMELHGSLAEHIEEQLGFLNEYELEEAALEERRRNKKWWQFWI